MGGIRAPFLWLAAFALTLAVAVEAGSVGMLQAHAPAALNVDAPGWGVRYLALLDLTLLFGIVVQALETLPKVHDAVSRVLGPVTLVLSLLGCLAAIVMAMAALAMLTLMVVLLIAVPFGTLAYLAAWSSFPTGQAQAAISLVMFLKGAFCVLLLLAQQGFLANKPLVALIAVSLGLTWLVSFLIAFPPDILVSITDVVGALVIAVVAVVWLAILCIQQLMALIGRLIAALGKLVPRAR